MLRQQRGQRSASRPSIGFVGTNPGLPRLLAGTGPEAVGGAELQLSLLASGLAGRGYDVSFGVGGYEDVRDTVTEHGVRMTVLYNMCNGVSQIPKVLRPLQIVSGLRRMPTDIVIAMGAGAQAGVLAAWCRLTRRRFIFWLASDTDAACHVEGISRVPRRERWLAYRGLTWSDTIVVQTRAQADAVREHIGREATLIPNIWPHEIGLADEADEPYALWVSNIRPEKRPEMLLEIAAELPEIRFVMIGGPVTGYEQLHEHVAATAAALPNVDFLGYVPFEDTHGWFRGARVLVNTSAVEGFPNTYLQAWAAGKPVVATFDPDGVIASRGLGRVFMAQSDGADVVRGLWEDDGGRGEIGGRAVAYMHVGHGDEAVMAQVEGLVAGQ